MAEVIDELKAKRRRKVKAKGLGLKQILAKKYKMLEGLPEDIKRSFGELPERILMSIYGQPKNGKSRLVMRFLSIVMKYGNVLYWGLEEGHNLSMQRNVRETLNEKDHSGRIIFYDHTLTYDDLVLLLEKKKSPKTLVIDSLQYAKISVAQYKFLKEKFPNKSILIISHAVGKKPKGTVAGEIVYDVDIIVWVEGKVAFVESRFGGGMPFIIWEEAAVRYWTKRKVNQFKK